MLIILFMVIPMVSPIIIMKITLELAGRDGSSVHWKADNGLGNEVGFARGRPGPPLAVGPDVVQRFKMRTTMMIIDCCSRIGLEVDIGGDYWGVTRCPVMAVTFLPVNLSAL